MNVYVCVCVSVPRPDEVSASLSDARGGDSLPLMTSMVITEHVVEGPAHYFGIT